MSAVNNEILLSDLDYILDSLSQKQRQKLQDSTILITGIAGFLGFYLAHFFVLKAKELGIKKVIGLDNFMLRRPEWIDKLAESSKDLLEIHHFNIISDKLDSIKSSKDVTHIIHAASIASPSFYREYPLETLDANIWGLRNLLDFYKDSSVKGFLFFSSSEIYGDPDSSFIPTSEEYRGNVSCIGPRACYDESKRFGETMCEIFANKFNMPLSIVRPFNNYGGGMSLNDKRVPSDFARAVMQKQDVVIFSDGSPKRTFCYIADAISGYVKALVHSEFSVFNIGIDKPEISIAQLAEIYKKVSQNLLKFSPNIIFKTSQDKNYLTDNPNRRCPNINKARELLSFNPQISVESGVEKFIRFLLEEQKNECK